MAKKKRKGAISWGDLFAEFPLGDDGEARHRDLTESSVPTNNAVVVSDIHAGCGLALCPPGDIPLDDKVASA